MRYMIVGKVTVSCWTYVEADSEDAALKEADSRGFVDMIPSGTAFEGWVLDTDGEPTELSAEVKS